MKQISHTRWCVTTFLIMMGIISIALLNSNNITQGTIIDYESTLESEVRAGKLTYDRVYYYDVECAGEMYEMITQTSYDIGDKLYVEKLKSEGKVQMASELYGIFLGIAIWFFLFSPVAKLAIKYQKYSEVAKDDGEVVTEVKGTFISNSILIIWACSMIPLMRDVAPRIINIFYALKIMLGL